MKEYSLASFRINDEIVPVIQVSGRCFNLTRIAPELIGTDGSLGLMPLFRDWKKSERALVALAERLSTYGEGEVSPPDNQTHILSPLLYPSKVICTGANYRDPLKEERFGQFDKLKIRTPFFLKPPTTSVVGSGQSVHAPRGVTQLDWEIELVAIIGAHARHVRAEDALQHVAMYTIGIDLSARDLLVHPGNMTKLDVFGGKAFDDSCPIGPRLVPSSVIGNPQDLQLKLSVNGVLKQGGSTSMMIWSLAEQIAQISSILTLEPGDLILTGTPPGTAFPDGPFLEVGDRIEAEIEKIGILEVEIMP